MPLREWTAVMAGDTVIDRHGRAHLVERVEHEGEAVWVGFVGGGVLRVPDRRERVDLIEGSGWGAAADSDAAQAWAEGEIARVMDGERI